MADTEVNPPVKANRGSRERRNRQEADRASTPRSTPRSAASPAEEPATRKTSICRSSDSGTKVWKPSSRPPWPGSIRQPSAQTRAAPARPRKPAGADASAARKAARACAPARSSACAARASSSISAVRARAFSRSTSSRATCPLPGSTIEVVVNRFDPEEGIQVLRRKGAAIDADWETLRKGVIVEARVTKSRQGRASKSTSTASAASCRSARSTSRGSKMPRPTSIRNSRPSSPRPISARKTSSSRAASCWNKNGPSSASAPGRRSKKGKCTTASFARSRASAPSSTSAASTGSCRSVR